LTFKLFIIIILSIEYVFFESYLVDDDYLEKLYEDDPEQETLPSIEDIRKQTAFLRLTEEQIDMITSEKFTSKSSKTDEIFREYDYNIKR